MKQSNKLKLNLGFLIADVDEKEYNTIHRINLVKSAIADKDLSSLQYNMPQMWNTLGLIEIIHESLYVDWAEDGHFDNASLAYSESFNTILSKIIVYYISNINNYFDKRGHKNNSGRHNILVKGFFYDYGEDTTDTKII